MKDSEARKVIDVHEKRLDDIERHTSDELDAIWSIIKEHEEFGNSFNFKIETLAKGLTLLQDKTHIMHNRIEQHGTEMGRMELDIAKLSRDGIKEIDKLKEFSKQLDSINSYIAKILKLRIHDSIKKSEETKVIEV